MRLMDLCRGLLLVSVVGTLASCKVGPNFRTPHETVPARFSGAQSGAEAEPAFASDTQPVRFWWHEFNDVELDHLEEQAAAGNLDLKAAYLRIVQSRAQWQAARAQGLPSLKGTASYQREQLGLGGFLKSQHVDVPPAQAGVIGEIEKPLNLYTLGFDASWELDLFGKVRRAVEAADAQSLAAVEARRDLQVSLQAEVASTYLQLRAAQVLRKIVSEQISAQRDITDLSRDRLQHGLGGLADVESSLGQLRSLEAQLPQYELQIDSARHALAVLTGGLPEAFDGQYAEGELPPLPQTIPVGLPSELARRRPDVRQSEAMLHAATAQVGVSVASMFPDIALTGSSGLRNSSTGYLFDWASRFYSFGPSISVPIFQGGGLVANVRLSRAQAEEAALSYRKTVLNALQEVEDGLSGLHQDARRVAALRDSVDANQRALDVDVDAFRHGIITYVAVLTVQLQVVQAREALTQALATQSTDLVRLYKALGGGWDTTNPAQAANSAP